MLLNRYMPGMGSYVHVTGAHKRTRGPSKHRQLPHFYPKKVSNNIVCFLRELC